MLRGVSVYGDRIRRSQVGVKATIDGILVEVEPGTTILQAAKQAGIDIPTLCYDTRLAPFGACRMCVVQIEQMGTRLVTACAAPVVEGWIVHTNTPLLKKIRDVVLELLLIHHPLDCPVCDKAGECKLQRLAFEYGPDKNRLLFSQERFNDPIDLRSPLIERDTNRCVLCGLCARMCEEFQSVGEISFVGRGFVSFIGTVYNRPLECEFCGQCVSVCPVGALMPKPFRHKVRAWELASTPSVCTYCGVGCRIEIDHKGDKVYRVRANPNVGVNEGALCGRGRFGFEFINSQERLDTPRVRKDDNLVSTGWGEAVKVLANGLLSVVGRHGPDAVGALVSGRLTNEEVYQLNTIFKDIIRSDNVATPTADTTFPILDVLYESFGVGASTLPYEAIDNANCYVVLGYDFFAANPVASTRMVRANRRFYEQKRMISIGPKRGKIGLYADVWIPAPAELIPDAVAAVIKVMLEKGWINLDFEGADALKSGLAKLDLNVLADALQVEPKVFEQAAEVLHDFSDALVAVNGFAFLPELNRKMAQSAVNLVLSLGGPTKTRGIFALSDRSNLQGIYDQGLRKSPVEILKKLKAGAIKALYLVGVDPTMSLPGGRKLLDYLAGVEFIAVQDLFKTPIVNLAKVVLPASTFAEKSGTYTSGERRIQKLNRAVGPIGDSKPDGAIFELLSVELGKKVEWNPQKLFDELAGKIDGYKGLNYSQIPDGGILWPKGNSYPLEGKKGKSFGFEPATYKSDGFYAIVGPVLYHSGTTTLKTALSTVYSEPKVDVFVYDADGLGIIAGRKIRVKFDGAEFVAVATLSKELTPRVVFVPIHYPAAMELVDGQNISRVKVELIE